MLALALLLLASPEIHLLTLHPRTYELVELEISLVPGPVNPFDPSEAAVDAVVTAPSGRVLRVPAFWYQDFSRSLADPKAEGANRVEQLMAVGAPGWHIRFASPEAGVYRVAVEWMIAGQSGHSAPIEVALQPGTRSGFIRRSPRNPMYLEDDSGSVFFPIGENLCMYEKREGTYYFDRLLEKIASNGANYVRLWQEYYVPKDPALVGTPENSDYSGFPLETQATGLGRYDLASAWRLDHVTAECERRDIYYQITFEMTVWWQTRQKNRWQRNPYNAANGGPCVRPQDYFTNERARELVRRRLRYSLARWGWSTHLAAWELWNEVDNNEGFDPAANEAWHREMAGYLKSLDPWKHLITTSWRDSRMFAMPEIDIVQAHSYWGAEYDAAEYAIQDTDHLMRPYGKPFFFGEQGVEDPGGAVSSDPDGHHFHDALWASALSGAAGAGMYWWWHNYVEPLGLYLHYKPLAAFLRGEDLAARTWSPPHESRPNLPVSLVAYGLVARDRALLWIHDPLGFRVVDGKPTSGPAQVSASLNVVGLDDGDYVVEWWDTLQGKMVRQDTGLVNHSNHFGYGLELKPPEFWRDIAARVVRKTKP